MSASSSGEPPVWKCQKCHKEMPGVPPQVSSEWKCCPFCQSVIEESSPAVTDVGSTPPTEVQKEREQPNQHLLHPSKDEEFEYIGEAEAKLAHKNNSGEQRQNERRISQSPPGQAKQRVSRYRVAKFY